MKSSIPSKFALMCDVLRPASGSDCTNGGATSTSTRVILIGPEGTPDGQPLRGDLPVLKIVVRNIGGEYIHAEPLVRPENVAGPMAGGNFIYSCDSRFRAICPYPIPVHDRFETWEQNDLLSR